MKKILMCLVSFSAFALLGSGCVSLESHERVRRHLENEQEANAALAAENERQADEIARLSGEDKKNKALIDQMHTAAANTPVLDEESFMDMIRKTWGPGMDGFEMVQSGGAMGVRLDDSGVLFKSGSWDLTDNTKEKLSKLASIVAEKLKSNANVFVRVDGHTDTDPVKKLKSQGIRDNMHLSTMRAMAVKDFLASKGVPADRIFVAGFGEYWPLNTGNTAKDKQRNRRVEVYLGDADALSIGALPGASVSK